MNNQMLGIIDAAVNQQSLQDLTAGRSIGAVPFAGRYRLIDFALSSMVNSGIRSVAVFSRPPYRSLMDHLGSGQEWDLNRKRDGLFFLPASLSHDENAGWDHFISLPSILIILREAHNNMQSSPTAIQSVKFRFNLF